MIPQFVIIIVLALLLCAVAITLWLDARERRMDRQVAVALPISHPASLASIRRLETGSRSRFLHRLVNYRAEVAYAWHPAYVLLAGVIAAAAIFYANRLLGFSILTVSTRGCDCGHLGGARSVWRAATSARQSTFSTATRHDPARDKYRSIRAACERSISHHRSRDAATNGRAVCYRMQRIESGEASGGSCGSCLSANASGGVWDVCHDTCGPVEVRWQSGRNLADFWQRP